MDFTKLLQGVDCACGKHHSCDIGFVAIERGAIRHLKRLCRGYNSILVVADGNTYAAAGEKTEKALAGKKLTRVIFSGSTVLIPNEDAIAQVQEALPGNALIVGIGSGVIQDLCKYVSFYSGIPYYIVATAPSMDGYASTGAAMITGGMKVTYSAKVPEAILADTEILKDAPFEMIQAGYGDIVGKYSALNDWKLSHAVNGEYLCRSIYDMIMEALEQTLKLADGLVKREEESVRVLMEALVLVGVAMSFTGSSRPASGSEHHLSHFFEITGIVNSEDYFPHGIDVAYSTVVTAKLREELLNKPWPKERYIQSRQEYERQMQRVYGPVAQGCMELQDKVGFYAKALHPVYMEKETEIRSILAEIPKASKIEKMLEAVGLSMKDFHELYSDRKIIDAIAYAKDLKDRYTVLWLYNDLLGGKNHDTFDFKNAMAVAAHRGDSYNCYENTMDAFQAAYADGVEMIETDVRLTADRQLVLFHDDRLGRITGVKANVNELTLAQLHQLNVGDIHHPAQIPTLEEFLQWAAPLDVLLNIELKEYNIPGNEGAWEYCTDEAVRLVRKYGLEDRVVLNSFDASVLDYIDRKYDHSFRLHGFYPYTGMKNVDRNPDEYLYCACIWGCSKKKEHYDYLIAHGIEPWVGAGITSAEALKLCCEYGARLVTTNYPADAIEKLKGLGKRA